MDAKYRITITDLNSGELIDTDGLRGSFETRFGLVCALASSGDEGCSFVTAIAGRDFTLTDALGKPGAALMLYGMVLLAQGVDPVPEEGEP